MSLKRRTLAFAAPVLALGLLAGACSSDDKTSSTDTTTSGGGSSATGSINISGSSTVQPISQLVAELWEESGSKASVTVDGPGTGDGFKLFCTGETDISDASRPIKETEAEDCAANGVEFIELAVAFDGLTVMTSPDNTTVECLTLPDLYALVGPESEGFDNWTDAQALATELGSTTVFPDAPLDITAPGTESGTYDAFIELALADVAKERVTAGKITEDQAGTTRSDYTSQANDNAILQGIEGSTSSFGWVGFAFAEEAGDQIKEIEIDAGDGCTPATIETIADGTYPLSRTLYIYVNKAKAESNAAVAEYVDFYLGEGISAVEETGYVPLLEDLLTASQTTWTDRTTGTQVSK